MSLKEGSKCIFVFVVSSARCRGAFGDRSWRANGIYIGDYQDHRTKGRAKNIYTCFEMTILDLAGLQVMVEVQNME